MTTLKKLLELEEQMKITFKQLLLEKPDRNVLYMLADKSRVYKEWACHKILTYLGEKEDLLKVVQRSFDFRDKAANKLFDYELTDEELNLIIDKSPRWRNQAKQILDGRNNQQSV